jgi:hypothetical protein
MENLLIILGVTLVIILVLIIAKYKKITIRLGRWFEINAEK